MLLPNFPQSLCFQEHGLFYASLGWRVFPLVPNSKRPATKRGFYDATTATDQICRWWPAKNEEGQGRGSGGQDQGEGRGEYNIGIRTGDFCRGEQMRELLPTKEGSAGGLYVLDVDPRNGGEDSVRRISETRGNMDWLDTLHCVTGGGGRHYYYHCPSREDLRCEIERAWKGSCANGIDLKGSGGYVVAPPSVNEHGGRYLWAGGGQRALMGGVERSVFKRGAIAEVPESLQEVLERRDKEKSSRSSMACREGERGEGNARDRQYGKVGCDYCVELVGVGEGSRNSEAASLAGKLWRQYGSRVIVVSLLESWNEKNTPPLSSVELEAVINSVSRYHK